MQQKPTLPEPLFMLLLPPTPIPRPTNTRQRQELISPLTNIRSYGLVVGRVFFTLEILTGTRGPVQPSSEVQGSRGSKMQCQKSLRRVPPAAKSHSSGGSRQSAPLSSHPARQEPSRRGGGAGTSSCFKTKSLLLEALDLVNSTGSVQTTELFTVLSTGSQKVG